MAEPARPLAHQHGAGPDRTAFGTGSSTALSVRIASAVRPDRGTRLAGSRSPCTAAWSCRPAPAAAGASAGAGVAGRPRRLCQRARRPSRSRPRSCAISTSAAAARFASSGMASGGLAGGGVAGRRLVGRQDAVGRLAVLAAALLQGVALAAQAGEGGPGGVRQPAGGGDQLVQRGALLAPSRPTISACLVPGRNVTWAGSGGGEPSPSASSPLLSESAGPAGAVSCSRQAAGSSRPSSSPGAKASTASLVRPMVAACGRSPAWLRPWSPACAACRPARSGWWRAGRW